MSATKNKFLSLAITLGILPVLHLLIWGFMHLFLGGLSATRGYDQWIMANFASAGVQLWIVLAIVTLIASALFFYDFSDTYYGRRDNLEGDQLRKISMYAGTALLMVAAICVVQIWRTAWDNDKDSARYYNGATVVHAPDIDNPPDSIRRLTKGAKTSSGRCELVGSADVPSCVVEGSLEDAGWEPRTGSLDGARIALERTSGDVQRVSLNKETLSYLNAQDGQPGRWSGILDGQGINVPLGGVAEWEGSGTPKQCLFYDENAADPDKYAIDRAFDGGKMNSLPNLLATEYPDLRWNMSDVWGYCDGKEPIVVIPAYRQEYFKDRTVNMPGGLIIVRGDRGNTRLQRVANAKPGDYPGPVYPASLVVAQREAFSWAAGRENQKRNGFGYEPAESSAQAGNVSEYLLRNKKTNRLEWVTPLTLRDSSSELFVAYAVSPADVATDGELNRMDIYVLATDDPRRINIDNLEADARNYLTSNAGTFISNGGKLVEFTPVDGDVWRAFGELNGRVVYRLDISASRKITTKLVRLDAGDSSSESDDPSNANCGKPISGLTPNELTVCIQQMADELVKRQSTAVPADQ